MHNFVPILGITITYNLYKSNRLYKLITNILYICIIVYAITNVIV